MPQTREAINHAQAAGVPMVFAFNKIDKEGPTPDKIREQLSQDEHPGGGMGRQVPDPGDQRQERQGVDQLLEKVLLEADLLGPQGRPRKARPWRGDRKHLGARAWLRDHPARGRRNVA
jgi:translation initiation factor IF-2